LIFIIQFSVSCAALGFPESSEKELIKDGWQFFLKHDNETIFLAESAGNCCGLENKITEGYNCEKLPCFDKTTPGNISNCDTCMSLIEDKLSSHFSYVGSIGLFFAFTEFIGMYIACRYRNMVDDGISTTAGAMWTIHHQSINYIMYEKASYIFWKPFYYFQDLRSWTLTFFSLRLLFQNQTVFGHQNLTIVWRNQN